MKAALKQEGEDVEAFSLSLNQAGTPLGYLCGPPRARRGRGSQLELTTGPQHPLLPPLGVDAVVCSSPQGLALSGVEKEKGG